MVVYVVKTIVYDCHDHVDVYGVYSNLALAGRAVMQFINYATTQKLAITFDHCEKPWGYLFNLIAHTGEPWHYGEVEIGRVTIDE